MSIAHHPGEELLLAYASGAADEGVGLLVAAHLALCPQCRAVVAEAEAAGGVMFSHLAPEPMAADALASVLGKLDSEGAVSRTEKKAPRASAQNAVPEPLRTYLGGDFDQVAWRPVAGGISHFPLFRRGRTRVELIRAKPGAGVATHTHRGEELTLVLAGGFSDVTGTYARGDVQTTSPDILHRPLADSGEDCINLAVTEGALIFQSLPFKVLGRMFGF
ncbi:MAG TPA: ChrR family anti-sigma-E factor [Rhizomicrobium sp.]|jgi:putative transcriptional regulator|nr:ChrR family anti-sigma-E factor [Rhizomicrobium sp.]